MSIPLDGRAFKKHLALAGILVGTVALSGCSSLGALGGGSGFPGVSFPGVGLDSSLVTGSIDPAGSGAQALTTTGPQPLPPSLSSATGPRGPYLPPANVGGPLTPGSLTQARLPVTTQVMPSLPGGGAQGVATQLPSALPTPQSTQVRSPQAMPAQAIATPLFQDNPVPQVAPRAATPQLSVVAQGGVFQHTIETGESLYSIARRYDVTTDAIVQANNLSAPDQIYVGQKVIIPGRTDLVASTSQTAAPQSDNVVTGSIAPVVQSAPAAQDHQTSASEQSAPVQVATAAPATAAPAATPVAAPAADNFRWPVTGRVIVDFEASRRTGINIEAPEGASVRAAESGSVIYVGSGVEGYGNLILVRHTNGFVSAYAHLKDITVAKNDTIRRGDQIGTIGMTGSVNRPQLHFELRRGATPVDPMPLLAN